jgi:hypothetical protein
MDVGYAEFTACFGWENLFGEEPTDPTTITPTLARQRMPELRDRIGKYPRVVLMGDVVALAFDCGESRLQCGMREQYLWHRHDARLEAEIARMPHPSAGNPRWHSPDYREPARIFLKDLLAWCRERVGPRRRE